MPVEQVPGFWDYLNQGIDQGIERSREDTKLKQQQNQANASLVGQLFGMGAVDDTALTGALKNAGMPAGVVIKSKAQRRKEALESGNIDALSDDEKRELGFQTGVEKKVEAAKGAEADFSTKRLDAMNRAASGEKLSDVEYQITGLSTPGDREMERLKQMDPFLGQVGDRYVAGAINLQPGSKIAPGQAASIAEKAYSDYVANRAQSGLGTLTPQEIEYTKSYFQRAAQNALIAQKKLDIAEFEAGSGRIAANQPRSGAGANPGIQWFKTLNTTVDILRKKQQDIIRDSPMVLKALQDPNLAKLPMVQGALQEYQEAGRQMEAYRQAQSMIADGQVPPNLNELLAGATQMTQPPKGAPGGVPAGATSDPISAASQRLASGQVKESDLQALVQQGRITQDQYMKIIQGAAALKKGGKP